VDNFQRDLTNAEAWIVKIKAHARRRGMHEMGGVDDGDRCGCFSRQE